MAAKTKRPEPVQLNLFAVGIWADDDMHEKVIAAESLIAAGYKGLAMFQESENAELMHIKCHDDVSVVYV